MSEAGYEASEEFGRLYDAIPAYADRADVAFYAAEAARVAGDGEASILEVGCGTGRVLLPLARAGHAMVGVDASRAMLARCREQLSAEPPSVRERVTLHETDLRRLSIAPPVGGFALAIAPFRVLQHLVAPADQLRALAAIRSHLAPAGVLALDVFNPHFALMTTDRSGEVEDTPEQRLPDGRTLRRTVRVLRVRWVEQVSEIELIYHLGSGGETRRITQSFDMRWFTPAELEHLLARAGFRIEARYGDFTRAPLGDASPEIVVVARRTE